MDVSSARRIRQMATLPTLLILLLTSCEVSAECLAAGAGMTHAGTRNVCGHESPSHVANLRAMTGLPVAARAGAADALESSHRSLARAQSAARFANQQQNAPIESRVQQSLSGVRWADSRDWIHNPPEWLKAARNYRRQGMPIIHLLQSQDKNTLLALGVSNHGKPGLYLTQKLPF